MCAERRRVSLTKYGGPRRKSLTNEVDIGVFQDQINSLQGQPSFARAKIADAVILRERMLAGYRIVDLRLDRFADALRFIRDNFFTAEPMCVATGLSSDTTSAKTYLGMMLSKMSNMHSLGAFREGSGELVGIAIASITLKGDQSCADTRTRPCQGETLFRVMMMKNCVLGRSQPYDRLNIDKYFCIHALCVSPNHRCKGIGTALVRSCVSMARELLLPACVGGFTSGAGQTVAAKLGFSVLAEMPYREFKTCDKEEPFKSVAAGSYSFACMALPIVTLPAMPAKKS